MFFKTSPVEMSSFVYFFRLERFGLIICLTQVVECPRFVRYFLTICFSSVLVTCFILFIFVWRAAIFFFADKSSGRQFFSFLHCILLLWDNGAVIGGGDMHGWWNTVTFKSFFTTVTCWLFNITSFVWRLGKMKTTYFGSFGHFYFLTYFQPFVCLQGISWKIVVGNIVWACTIYHVTFLVFVHHTYACKKTQIKNKDYYEKTIMKEQNTIILNLIYGTMFNVWPLREGRGEDKIKYETKIKKWRQSN